MSFTYIPPEFIGGTTPGGGGTIGNLKLHDDLTAQIDGVKDVFIVSQGKYDPGSLDCTIGALGMTKGVHYFEHDPTQGMVRTARPLTVDDLNLIARYTWTT